jgi:hypothetical protein
MVALYVFSLVLGGGFLALSVFGDLFGGHGDVEFDGHLELDAGGMDVDVGDFDLDAGGVDMDVGLLEEATYAGTQGRVVLPIRPENPGRIVVEGGGVGWQGTPQGVE